MVIVAAPHHGQGLILGCVFVASLQVGCSSESDHSDSMLLSAPNGPAVDVMEVSEPPPASASAFDDAPVLSNNGPARDSGITIDDRRYELDAALADVWGYRGSHYNVNFTVTNGKFSVEPTEVDGEIYNLLVPAEASAVVYAQMYYPGEGFNFSEFIFQAQSAVSTQAISTPFFTGAYVGFDSDGSGTVELAEHHEIIDGTMTFSGLLPNLELSFSLLLDNGQSATGHYTGLFDFTQR